MTTPEMARAKAEGRLNGISETAGIYHLSHKPCDGFTKCPEPDCVAAFARFEEAQKDFDGGGK